MICYGKSSSTQGQKLKAMNTPRALAQLVKRAEELSEKGENIKELMEEANSNGWKTIYEKDGRDERRKNRSASKNRKR